MYKVQKVSMFVCVNPPFAARGKKKIHFNIEPFFQEKTLSGLLCNYFKWVTVTHSGCPDAL